MATNLFELAKGVFSGDRIQRLSEYFGENELQTRAALDGALPTILGGLVQRSAEPNGIGRLLDIFRQDHDDHDDTLFDRLGERAEGDDEFRRMSVKGSSLLTAIFGDKSPDVSQALASYSGVSTESGNSILNLVGSTLLGLLSTRLGNDRSSAAGLTAYLSEQREAVAATMPSRLGAMLGDIPGLGWFSSTAAPAGAAAASLPRVDPVADVTGEPRIAPPRPSPDAERPVGRATRESRGMGSWVPWVALFLGIIALIYFLRSCGQRPDSAMLADSTQAVLPAIDTVASDARTSADNTLDRLGAFAERSLPSNVRLTIPERGVENQLVDFIESNQPVDKTTWFDFDRLLFETGSAKLNPSSEEQLKNVAEILRAYPNVAVKIGGYTDNTGDAAANRQLSTDRANSVVAELKRLGVAANRLEAEGYGSSNPVATNETEAGRQQNRRISIRVMKK
jgi:OOP family OmpA-OmpF porin